jgi:hypothetical protein
VGDVALEGDRLEVLVGLDQRERARCLVGLAALDADSSVLDHVEAAPAVGADDVVHPHDQLVEGQRVAVDRHGHALFEPDDHLARLAGLDRGHAPDALGRPGPRVLHLAALDGTTPEVVVDRVQLLLGGQHGDVVGLGVLDAHLARHAPVAHGGEDVEVGGEGPRGDLEADLVVALAGATVGHGVGAVVAGGGDQVAHDHRARERRHQRVATLVEGVGLERRGEEVVGELLAAVDDDRLDRPCGEGLRLQALPVTLLAEVARDGDHLDAVVLDHPAHGHGRVETAAVGQDHSLRHRCLPRSPAHAGPGS